jgi:succinyl-diaminopimelate desuccinylase
VVVDDMVYREVFTATGGWTTNARNVVPDAFTINVNYRFAPDKTLEEAEAQVLDLVGGRASVKVVDRAPAGRPRREDALVGTFLDSVGAAVEPKQAWTDVARFSEVGVPALNYGPGITAQAHQAGEYVPEGNLRVARDALTAFLSGR